MRSPAPVPLPDSAVPITAMPMAAPIRFGGGPAYGYAPVGPYRAGRPSTCGSPLPISTCCRCPPGERVRAETSPCCRTSSPPVTTARALAGVSSGGHRGGLRRRPGRAARCAQLLPARGGPGLRSGHAFVTGWPWPRGSAPPPVSIADGDPARADHWMPPAGPDADRGIEAVGYQAHDPAGDEHPEMVLDSLVRGGSRRPAGSAWSGSTCRAIRRRPARARSRAESALITGPSSRKGSRWGPDSARPQRRPDP